MAVFPSFSSISLLPVLSYRLGSKYSDSRFQNFRMQGFYDFPQEVRGSLFEEEKYITSIVIILLGILFIYGTYLIIIWCSGPRLEDLFRG